MKLLFNIPLIIFLFFTQELLANSSPYIQFVHVASTEPKYIRPILISEQTLDKSPFFHQSEYDDFKKLLPNKDDFLNSRYNFVVTDHHTFKLINKYINHQQKIHSHINLMASGYMIMTTRRKQFFISDEDANQFFNELIIYLIKKGCDQNVTNALKYK